MHKIIQWIRTGLLTLSLGLVGSTAAMAQSQTSEIHGDYHLSLYPDMYGDVLEFEAFTKIADQKSFFGLSCSSMSPFPMLQILLFDDDIVSETPRFLKASYEISGLDSFKPVAMQGILQATLTADEFSNRIRLELDPQAIPKDLRVMKSEYARLLKQLSDGEEITVMLDHRSFGEKSYQYSLKGMDSVIQNSGSLCR